jgi:Rps23 Pro-64 3,4-dihydroxylase Tpa1-like proline 4-hydroxylase
VPKNKVKISTKQWSKKFTKILEEFKQGLGLPKESRLEADLHSILVYEPGCFFNGHRDSEKVEGMVATMIVLLPTEYTGGELIIEHDGERRSFTINKSKTPKLHCGAFYADCYHEIKEVTSGYRVSLTYNLILKNYKGVLDEFLNKDFDQRLKTSLTKYFDNGDSLKNRELQKPKKFIYLLDHQYTESSLSWDLLKNKDRFRVDSLIMISEELKLSCYLTLADMRETWECEMDYDEYTSYRSKRKDDNPEEANPSYIMDTEVVLKHWIDRDGTKISIKGFAVDNASLCYTGDNEMLEPYNSEFEGWCGNYGNTLDRWYHRAAIVLWKKEDYYAVMFEIDIETFMNKISLLLKDSSSLQELQTILKSVSPYWKRYANESKDASVSNIKQTLDIASIINNTNISKNLLAAYTFKSFTKDNILNWITMIKLYGDSWVLELLEIYKKKIKNSNDSYIIPCFNKIITELDVVEYPKIQQWLLKFQYSMIVQSHRITYETPVEYKALEKKRIQDIAEFADAILLTNNDEVIGNLALYLIKYVNSYPVLSLESICEKFLYSEFKNSLGIKALKDHILSKLSSEYEKGMRNAQDQSILDKPNCKCEDCKTLEYFLIDKVLSKKIWPIAEARRNHVENVIKNVGIPLNVRTDTNGRPYKLVLTKSNDLYKTAKSRYLLIEKVISKLTNI